MARKLSIPIIPISSLLSVFVLVGCDQNLNCASDDVKATAVSIVKEHQPTDLLMVAEEACLSRKEVTDADEAYNAAVETWKYSTGDVRLEAYLTQQKAKTLHDAETAKCNLQQAYNSAIYSLEAIRTTAKDSSTGRVSCAAELHAQLPNNVGAAKVEITYRVEKTSDGDIYVSVLGLQ